MQRLVKPAMLVAFMLPVLLQAQTESLRLKCPLDEAVIIPPPKNAMKYDITDLCIVLTSIPDSIVKACTTGKVTNVMQNEDDNSKWEVVIFRNYKGKDYYFWYSGLEKIIVRRNEVVQEGQSLGFIKPGANIELLMYDFETPIDPTKFLDCKGILKTE